MSLFRRHRAKHAELDARVRAAEREKDESLGRLARIRREVIRPLHEAGERNQFAEMIRRSLMEGK